jgi:hypothetical protein
MCIGSGCVVLQQRGRDIQARHRRARGTGEGCVRASCPPRLSEITPRRQFPPHSHHFKRLDWRNDFACANRAAKRMRPMSFVVKPQEESDEYR